MTTPKHNIRMSTTLESYQFSINKKMLVLPESSSFKSETNLHIQHQSASAVTGGSVSWHLCLSALRKSISTTDTANGPNIENWDQYMYTLESFYGCRLKRAQYCKWGWGGSAEDDDDVLLTDWQLAWDVTLLTPCACWDSFRPTTVSERINDLIDAKDDFTAHFPHLLLLEYECLLFIWHKVQSKVWCRD